MPLAPDPNLIARAASLIDRSDAIVIAAGAGMGVDSGLPDFRGNDGFWRAYPALAAAGIEFESIANPQAFRQHPDLAWGFYGHRLALYRKTVPHAGFGLLQRWARTRPHGGFVFTSNVDGQFQRAGFGHEHVCEVHGSIHYLQCAEDCGINPWPADDFDPQVDEKRCLLVNELPSCPSCGGLARPNLLMFGDYQWQGDRYEQQRADLLRWARYTDCAVVIEIGAGQHIPTVRRFTERFGAHFIRINPTDAETPGRLGLGIRTGGLAALQAIDAALDASSNPSCNPSSKP